ncbi:probable inactive poly [ADP-ribose] polymerase SRO2 [Cornus florida]|uniref:probable inactive poly [ADP-ribose] polymerase SRO2 n=1 Tax=Cornus florida TaxID=4283 RepID=UPI00289A24E2|nr:probable inactive poly [ADP-ribose] polymerase SRO2 [Cornus florida]
MENMSEQSGLLSISMGSNNDEYVNGFSTTTRTLVDPGSEVSESVNQEKPSIPDCESEISGPNGVQSQDFGDGLIRVDEGDRRFAIIQERFFLGWGSLRAHSRVVAIHKYASSGFTGQARFRSFQNFKEAMENKCDGNANVRLTWYGASKNEIRKIISHGFGYYGKSEPKSNELYGRGIYLYQSNWSMKRKRRSHIMNWYSKGESLQETNTSRFSEEGDGRGGYVKINSDA